MKIAMLGQKRIPSREGGVEIVVEELSTRMVKKGHEVTCYNRGGKHALDKNVKTSNEKEYKGVKLSKCFTIDKKGLAAMTASFFGTLKAIFSKNDVVHYHAEGPCAWMWLVKWFTNKKIVATIHGLDWQRAKWGGFATKYIKFGEKCAAKYADEIIVLSENVKQYFKDTYNRETNFIPNGVSKPEIRKADLITKKFNLKKDDYILFLGRIVPEKGIHYLIDAYNESNVDKKLVIAGAASDTDTYYTELKEKAKGNKNIIFTGFVQGQMLEELYSNAYIYCLPSDLEGMPLSLLEAMSYQNCCLTSDIKECSEVLQDKGVTFEKSNVKDLIKQLKKLCKDSKEVKKYKNEAQEYILDKYNWDDVVDKTVDLYKIRNNENRKKKIVNKYLSIFMYLYAAIYLISLMIFKMGSGPAQIRYYLLAIGIVLCFIYMVKKNKKEILKKNRYNDLLHIILVGIVFVIISFFKAISNGAMMPFRVLVQTFLVCGPILFSYCLLNMKKSEEIIKYFKYLLVISVFLYFLESPHTIIDFLNINSYIDSFKSGLSFTESSLLSEVFLQLFLFFNYLRNINSDKKNSVSKNIVILSGVFTFLCWKRMAMLMVIITPVINYVVKKINKIDFKIKEYLSIGLCFLFIIGTIIYLNMLQHNIFTNINISVISTGRDYILSLWERHNYISYGYGSSMLLIGRYLELDLIQIYLELNIFCLALFCYIFMKISNKTIYGIFMMSYAMLNMLTASSLPYLLGWIITILSIKLIEDIELNNTMNKEDI